MDTTTLRGKSEARTIPKSRMFIDKVQLLTAESWLFVVFGAVYSVTNQYYENERDGEPNRTPLSIFYKFALEMLASSF